MEITQFFYNKTPEKTLYILFATLIAGIAEVSSVLLTLNGIQDVIAGRHYLLYACFLPIASVTSILFKRISKKQTALLTENILEYFYISIAQGIRSSELSEVEQLDSSEVRLKMQNAQTVTSMFTKGIHVYHSIVCVSCLWLYVFTISFQGGLAGILIFGLVFAVYKMLQVLVAPLADKENDQEKEVAHLFQHILYGAKEIRANRQKNDDLFQNYLVPIISQVSNTRSKLLIFFSQYWAFVYTCFYTGLGFFAFVLPQFYPQEIVLSIIILSFYVWGPVQTIIGSIPDIAKGKTVIDEMHQLSQKYGITSDTDENLRDPLQQDLTLFRNLRFENVIFRYEANTEEETGFSVGPINFSAKSGEVIFIAGGNGSGKTTLMKVLTGLYPVSDGNLKINEATVDIALYRYLFSTVFSDFHLFDALYGLHDIDDHIVQNMLITMGLDKKVSWVPHSRKFSTIRLSTGQRKRLALIIALMEDKPIYVFDEWAADQDPHFRKYFYESLLPSLKDQGKLIIAVSHDDRYFHMADHLIRMNYGRMESSLNQSENRNQTHSNEYLVQNPVPENKKNDEQTARDCLNSNNRQYSKNISDHPSADSETDKAEAGIANLLQLSKWHTFKPMLLNFLISMVCPSILVAMIFTAANTPSGESLTRLFFMFVITMTIYFITFNHFCKSFTCLIEDRIAKIRVNATNKIRQSSLYAFENVGVERIHTVLTYDIRAVSDLSNAASLVIRCVFASIGYFIFMGMMCPSAFILMLAAFAVVSLILTYDQMRLSQLVFKLRNKEKELFSAITDLFEGFKELRLNTPKNDDFFHSKFKKNCSHLKNDKLQAADFFIRSESIISGLWQFMFLLAVLVLPLTGFFSESLLLSFVGVVICVPVQFITDQVPRITLASISMKRLYEFGEELGHLEKDIAGQETPIRNAEFRALRYEDIFFRYKEDNAHPFSVGPLSVSFQAGDITFIVGGNGSGKSTLLNLLTGLYHIDSGKIFYNDQKTDIQMRRGLFSVIFSDFHLFDRLYGLSNIQTERVYDLLRLMHLEHRLEFNGEKFSSLELSTGERKRLAMVAAIMEDKPIYVFDEWAADQDPHFRQYFYETLLPSFKKQGKTVIAVTHDDRYFHVADQVIQLEYGVA